MTSLIYSKESYTACLTAVPSSISEWTAVLREHPRALPKDPPRSWPPALLLTLSAGFRFLTDCPYLVPSHTLLFCTLPRSRLYAFLPWYILRAEALYWNYSLGIQREQRNLGRLARRNCWVTVWKAGSGDWLSLWEDHPAYLPQETGQSFLDRRVLKCWPFFLSPLLVQIKSSAASLTVLPVSISLKAIAPVGDHC